ncbi:MAG: flagellar basal body P-ring formation chaperone FlgA [Mariprofundus sp.]|nr:flagellar basal body P-ring formation chaperone FlgA [Mariprofundus sp.]
MCRLNSHALLWMVTLILPMFALPMQADAEPDAAMQQSMREFFKQGVTLNSATAELVKVERWPVAKGALRWSIPSSLHNHPGRFSLIAEQHQRRWYVPVRVRWMATAVIMQKSISARSLLTQSMIKRTRTDIAGHSGSWWAKTADLVGMRSTRPLTSGDLILSSYVKRPPLINRGDLVTIMLDVGGLHIRTAGTALRAAKRGDRIMVRNARSKEIIQAIAEKRGLVRVALVGERS